MLTELQRLKLELLARGMSVTEQARQRLSGGAENRPITLADYATTSGVSLRLGDDIWVNAPIQAHNPNFVGQAPRCLDVSRDGFVLRTDALEVPAFPAPVPDYHDKQNRWAENYTAYSHTHTDRARISPIAGCAMTCRFCDMPYELQYRTKRVDGLVDAVRVALEDRALPARHVLISGGTPRRADFDYLRNVYRQVLTAFPGTPIDIMMVPLPGLLDFEALDRFGVNQLSLNIEMFNEARSRELMPAKAHFGRQHYLSAIDRAVSQLGPNRVRSLLLVGIEEMADTLAGVEELARRGCEPVLSPFRPDPSTPMRDVPPPSAEFLGEVYERSLEVAGRYDMKLGPRCIPCMHNTLTFPDSSGHYITHEPPVSGTSAISTR